MGFETEKTWIEVFVLDKKFTRYPEATRERQAVRLPDMYGS